MSANIIDYWQQRGHRLHLVTQDNQPYGSVRRCCERCGVMAGPYSFTKPGPVWTDDAEQYESDEYRCSSERWGKA
jgi:hypothetical protein